MRKEGGALDLLDVVEAGNADEALGEGGGAGADLLEDLIGVGAAVHGELPHNPVAVVVVARGDGHVHTAPAVGVGVGLGGGLELNAGGPAVVEEVLDLAGDLLVGEGGEEGESLEEPGEKEGVRRSATERELEKIKRNAFYRCPNPTDRGFSEKSSPTRAGTRPVRFARRRLPHRATTDACQTIVHDRIEHRWTNNDRDDPREAPRIACCHAGCG